MKRKTNSLKFNEKNFINRLTTAELKNFCICIGVYKKYESNDNDKIYEILSKSDNKKLKINNILIDNYIDMNFNHEFEQNYLDACQNMQLDYIKLVMIVLDS